MPARVVDASALAALLFGESEARVVAERLTGYSLVAPTLLPFELANVCLKKIRRYPRQRDALLAGVALLHEMQIELVVVPVAPMTEVAERFGLTAYDAAYVWVAGQLKAKLISLDRKLLVALGEPTA